MPTYNFYMVTEQRPLSSSNETIELQLGVQPLSALVFQLEAAKAANNTDDSVTTFLSKITAIEVLWRGTRIAAGRPTDLIATYNAVAHLAPEFIAPGVTAGSIRQANFAIPFTRKLFLPDEAFPASQKGDLVLIIRTAPNPSAYNNYTLTVQAIEIPDAKPTKFIRTTQLVAVIAATGPYDLDLPRVLPLLGVNVSVAARRPYDTQNSIQNIELLANNANLYLSSSRTESLEYIMTSNQYALKTTTHRHTENTAASYTQNAATLTNRDVLDLTDYNIFINLDPLSDGQYMLDTSKLSDLKLRMNVTLTGTIYINTVELATPDWLRLPR